MADGPVTRIEWVENQLRQALLSGELQPGERLLTAQLSERFQVSPTPLREALHRFAGEGLVEFVAQRGARVTELSRRDNAELTELRSLLEPPCLARAIGNGDASWRTEVDRRSRELRKCWQHNPHDTKASEHAYQSFYVAVTSTCDSARLVRYATAVRDQDARYRMATIEHMDRKALASIHRQLVKAALDLDAVAAATAIEREIALFSTAYVNLMDSHA